MGQNDMSSLHTVIECVEAALPPTTRDGLPSYLGPTSALWSFATEPYNTRLTAGISPLAIAYPETQDALAAMIKCASSSKLPAVARSGGHSYGAYSLGGSVDEQAKGTSRSRSYPTLPKSDKPNPGERSLIIDMRAFRHIEYEPTNRTVRVGSGALLGELGLALEAQGRMIPCGSCPSVGVGGQAVSGGFGLMSRSQGLLLDNMIEAELILANGEPAVVSSDHLPDLFWGIKGGGSSLAIAHSFTFRTHPAPPLVIYYELVLSPRALPSTAESVARASRLYMAFQEFGAIAPSGLGLSWHVTPEVDPGSGGYGTKVEILGQFMGSRADYDVVMKQFQEMVRSYDVGEFVLGQRELSYLQSMRNVGGDWDGLKDRGPLNIHEHVNFYAKSLVTKRQIPLETISNQLTYLLSLSSQYNPSSFVEWFVLSPYLGGEHSAVTHHHDGAFAHRDLKIVWEIYAKMLGDQESVGQLDLVGLVTNMTKDLYPIEAVYSAYIDPELSAEEYPNLVWGKLYPRLQGLKARYDPGNVFRSPQSIKASDESSFDYTPLLLIVLVGAVFALVIRSFRRRGSTGKRRRD